jgi:hypothetical protein
VGAVHAAQIGANDVDARSCRRGPAEWPRPRQGLGARRNDHDRPACGAEAHRSWFGRRSTASGRPTARSGWPIPSRVSPRPMMRAPMLTAPARSTSGGSIFLLQASTPCARTSPALASNTAWPSCPGSSRTPWPGCEDGGGPSCATTPIEQVDWNGGRWRREDAPVYRTDGPELAEVSDARPSADAPGPPRSVPRIPTDRELQQSPFGPHGAGCGRAVACARADPAVSGSRRFRRTPSSRRRLRRSRSATPRRPARTCWPGRPRGPSRRTASRSRA